MRKSFFTALLLAPLILPLIFSGVFAVDAVWSGMQPMVALSLGLPLLLTTALFSYGATLMIGLPLLFLAAHWFRLNAWRVLGAGALSGVLANLPLTWIFYQGSGENSGTPEPISVFQFLQWALLSETTLLCLFAGAVTASAFYVLSGMGRRYRATGADTGGRPPPRINTPSP